MSNGVEEREFLLPIPSRSAGQDSIFRVSWQYDHFQDISIIYQSGPSQPSVIHWTEDWDPCPLAQTLATPPDYFITDRHWPWYHDFTRLLCSHQALAPNIASNLNIIILILLKIVSINLEDIPKAQWLMLLAVEMTFCLAKSKWVVQDSIGPNNILCHVSCHLANKVMKNLPYFQYFRKINIFLQLDKYFLSNSISEIQKLQIINVIRTQL